MNNREDLFSVIVLHYNQLNYINEALDSVFAQDYGNIELIIADDASQNLDINSIQSYVEAHRTSRITSVKYQWLKENVGTVRNINQALKAASGKYAMFFAADDSLYDSHVLSNFVSSLSELPPDQYMVGGQCVMMDEKMKKKLGNFVNVPVALKMNTATPMEQYRVIVFCCTFAMGATAFRMDKIKDKGYFDETFKIIEDWSCFLSLTHGGSKIIYSDFNALKHRDGGVSHFNQEVLPPHVIEYRNDSLLIQEKLILPHLSAFPQPDQLRLLDRYYNERRGFAELHTDKPRPSRISIMRHNRKLYVRKMIWWLMGHVKPYRQKCLRWTIGLFSAWAILRILKIVMTQILDNQSMILNTQAFDVITYSILVAFFIVSIIMALLYFASGLFFIWQKKKEFFSKNI